MAWWGWLLVIWGLGSPPFGVWWGLALANADIQDAARAITEDVDVDHRPPAR